MIKKCIFLGCSNTSATTPEKIFVTVPKNKEKRKLWFEAAGKICRGKRSNDRIPMGRSYYCCEDHFDLENDAANWMFYKTMGTSLSIKDGVLPRKSARKAETSQLPIEVKKKKEEILSLISDGKSINDPEADPNIRINFSSALKTLIVTKDVYVDACATKAEKCLNTYETFSSDSDFEYFRENVKEEIDDETRGKSDLEKNELYCRIVLGLPRKEHYIIHLLEASLPVPLDNILLVLKKIQTDDGWTILANDFGVNEHEANWIFYTTLPTVANRMKEVIFWPKKENIEHFLPKEFQTTFRNVQSIIDCFEIRIGLKPEHEEKSEIVRFLVSCTPIGFVNFVSQGFREKLSNETIFQKSGFLEVIPENVTVLADKEFVKVVPLLQTKNVSVFCPTSVGRNTDFDEVIQSKIVSYLRLHIERLFGRIRNFKIFAGFYPIASDMSILLDDILVTICGIINLQELIIKQ